MAVEAWAGWAVVSSDGKFRLDFIGSLNQVGPIEGVAAKREDNVRVKFPINLR